MKINKETAIFVCCLAASVILKCAQQKANKADITDALPKKAMVQPSLLSFDQTGMDIFYPYPVDEVSLVNIPTKLINP